MVDSKKTLKKIVGYSTILYVIAGTFTFLDLVLNFFIRPNATRNVQSTLIFIAHDALANFILIFCIGAVVTASLAVYTELLSKRKKWQEFPWHVVYGLSASLLSVSVVGGLLNFTVLGDYASLESIIGNLALLISIPITAVLFSFLAKSIIRKKDRLSVKVPFAAVLSAVSVLIIIGYAVYAGKGTPVKREVPGAPNVLIITIDALRDDHVSYSGYDLVNTPVIDDFAERSVIFSDCHANSPWTIPSMLTMLTSRYPSTHGAHFTARGSDELTTLAEVLRENGYDTEAYVANTVLDGELGFDKGFSRYVRFEDVPAFTWVSKSSIYYIVENYKDQMAQWGYFQTTPWLTDVLCDRLETKRNRPFFIWAHYFDPHLPLNPPKRYIEGEPGFLTEADEFMKRQTPNISPGDKEIVVSLYRSEVKYVDDFLKRVFTVINERSLYENTLIVVSSDHGEEHFEHDHYGHGETHYDEVLAIPMVVYAPDLGKGVCERPVSLIDLTPTVLEYIGVEPPTDLKGQNMLGLSGNNPLTFSESAVYAEGTISDLSTRSVYIYPYILIREGGISYEYEMVDVRLRGKSGDIVKTPDPNVFEKYRVILDDMAATSAAEAETVMRGEAVRLDNATRERLKNLGYF
jgi:arylsulfatase A-like enzyme